MKLTQLVNELDSLLAVSRFKDYCPNGLQVEGRAEVKRIVAGVTASAALIEAAIACNADAILVHHGYFWKNEDPRVVGIKKNRLARLLAHDISLIAYHLPLDGHPVLGNNAQLAAQLGWDIVGEPTQDGLLWQGVVAQGTQPLHAVSASVSTALNRPPLVVGDPEQPIRRVAWCTGGAQGLFAEAIALGVDAYLTGEASEPCTHLARESGVAFIAAGHHATERYGIAALARHMTETLGVEVSVVEIGNPV